MTEVTPSQPESTPNLETKTQKEKKEQLSQREGEICRVASNFLTVIKTSINPLISSVSLATMKTLYPVGTTSTQPNQTFTKKATTGVRSVKTTKPKKQIKREPLIESAKRHWNEIKLNFKMWTEPLRERISSLRAKEKEAEMKAPTAPPVPEKAPEPEFEGPASNLLKSSKWAINKQQVVNALDKNINELINKYGLSPTKRHISNAINISDLDKETKNSLIIEYQQKAEELQKQVSAPPPEEEVSKEEMAEKGATALPSPVPEEAPKRKVPVSDLFQSLQGATNEQKVKDALDKNINELINQYGLSPTKRYISDAINISDLDKETKNSLITEYQQKAEDLQKEVSTPPPEEKISPDTSF